MALVAPRRPGSVPVHLGVLRQVGRGGGRREAGVEMDLGGVDRHVEEAAAAMLAPHPHLSLTGFGRDHVPSALHLVARSVRGKV